MVLIFPPKAQGQKIGLIAKSGTGFFFEAYDTKPVITAESGRRKACFVPLQDGSGAYMIQLLEWRQKQSTIQIIKEENR